MQSLLLRSARSTPSRRRSASSRARGKPSQLLPSAQCRPRDPQLARRVFRPQIRALENQLEKSFDWETSDMTSTQGIDSRHTGPPS